MIVSIIKRNINKLIKFGFVGVTGTILNLSVFYIMVSIFTIKINISSLCAFLVAVSSNYLLNHIWTFKAENEKIPINFEYYFSYIIGNLFGLLINLLVLNLIIYMMGHRVYMIAQLAGIFCGFLFNFIFAKKLVFTRVLYIQ